MIRIRCPRSWPLRALLALALLLVANSVAVRLTSEPLAAVREKAEEMYGGDEELSQLAGGYSAGLLGMSAHGTFAAGKAQIVEVEIQRPFAFMPWRLETYAARPAGQ